MADNILAKDMDVRPIAADDMSGVMYQRVKVVWGADNAVNDTSAAAPMPITVGTTSTVLVGDVSVGVRTTATNAASVNKLLAAGTTNATSVKGSAGRVYGWHYTNLSNAARFVKLYNKATAPTVGTDVPVAVIAIPAGQVAKMYVAAGVSFASGIGLATTTGYADNDSAAVTAGDIVGALIYA